MGFYMVVLLVLFGSPATVLFLTLQPVWMLVLKKYIKKSHNKIIRNTWPKTNGFHWGYNPIFITGRGSS